MSNPAEEIRARIHDNLSRVSRNSIAAAWDLGACIVEGMWRSFVKPDGTRWVSSGEWIKDEFTNHMSKSNCYDLAKIGVVFRADRDRIERMLAERKTGIVKLRKAARKLDQLNASGIVLPKGADPKSSMLDHLEHKTELPQYILDLEKQEDPDGIVTRKFTVKRGDLHSINRGLLRHALRNNLTSRDESFAMLAIGEDLDYTLPKQYEQWRDLIESGHFVCRECGKVPIPVNGHHVIPRSIGQGHGPIVPLCEQCHNVVTPLWRFYGEKWLGKQEFHDEASKIERQLGSAWSWENFFEED